MAELFNAEHGPINTEYGYAHRFRVTRTNTVALRDPCIFDTYVRSGFLHMRQLHYHYNKIMRLPTVGCYVELSVLPTVDSVPLHSPKARRIINRSSYF
jgi:hypothetical protein